MDVVDVETYSLGRGRRYGNTLDVTPLMTSERTLQQSVAGTHLEFRIRDGNFEEGCKVFVPEFFIDTYHQFSNVKNEFDKTNGELLEQDTIHNTSLLRYWNYESSLCNSLKVESLKFS